MEDKERMVKVTKAKGFDNMIPYDEYIEDNLIYHSMVHNMDVVNGQIDYLMDKGYLFQMLKRKAKDFQTEAFGHVAQQMKHMESVNNITFYNKTQRDYDSISDFLKGATPAKVTYLAEMIRRNEELHEMTDLKLRDMLERGEIEVEPERIGRSQIQKENDDVSSLSDQT